MGRGKVLKRKSDIFSGIYFDIHVQELFGHGYDFAAYYKS